MTDPKLRKTGAGIWTAVVTTLGVATLVFGAVVSARGQDAAPGETGVVTAVLEYQEVTYPYLNWGPPVSRRSEPFAKEPAWGSSKVIRGALQFGGPASNDVAFAWDRAGGKLCVDLNGNLDLTDDPGGVFSSQGSSPYGYQTFRNVHLSPKTPSGTRPILVDVTMRDLNRLSCSLEMKSLWQGKVTLRGKEWQVGLVERPLQQGSSFESCDVLLRPWKDHAQAFSQQGDGADVVPFSRKLYLDQQAYELRCAEEGSGEKTKVRVSFKELHPKLGELKLTGTFIRRLTFEGGGYQVVLDNPGETVKVPVGSYSSPKVTLEKGTTRAYLDRGYNPSPKRTTVNAKAPAVLEVGAPLTNCVSVRKQGRYLSLNYQLKGAGGDYRLKDQDRQHPPEFTVYKGERKVASGKFEYG